MYLLSVIIPTKDRYEYLQDCLKTLVNLNSEEVEIIVQDNTAENAFMTEFIEKLHWPHIKYYHNPFPLSQTENSDLAVSHATGEYCTYIGDDDSIAISAIDAARYLHNNKIAACVNNVATYHWSDVVFQGKEKPALTFFNCPCAIHKLKSKKVMSDFLKWGCQDIKFLPRIYHAIISRDILERIKERTGSYFPGPSPDMANAVSALLLIDEYVYIELPLIVSGYRYKSAGGMGLRGAHSGSLSGVKQLPANAEAEWSPRIPKVWLGYTVWPESAEKAFIHMSEEDYINRINYSAMYAKTFLKYPAYRKMVIENVNGIGDLFRLGTECLRFMTRWVKEHSALWIRTKNGSQYVNKNKISLQEACRIVEREYMENTGKSILS